MRSLFLVAVVLGLLMLGLRAPFVFPLAYVWADIVTPQSLAYSILPAVPISMLFAACSIIALFLMRKAETPVRLGSQTWLMLLLAAWMTLTLLWAEVPVSARSKWDWAFKSLVFCAFLPAFFRTGQQIEALIWVLVLSASAHFIPFGVKTVLSGGGYGMAYGLGGANSLWGEGSTLALYSVMTVPLLLYLIRHQTVFPQRWWVTWGLLGLVVLCVLTAIGTHARTGLVCLLVLGALALAASGRPLKTAMLSIALLALGYWVAPDVWFERMATIDDGNEGSAMGRVAVWAWTWDYVRAHPLGGSFNAFQINAYTLALAGGGELSIQAKAYHNIFFEMMGEGGFVGLGLFLALLWVMWKNAGRLRTIGRTSGSSQWVDLGAALQACLLVYCTGGMFVGVAFQSYFQFLLSLSTAAVMVATGPSIGNDKR